MTEERCADCVYYGMWGHCELYGEYTSEEWRCELFKGWD